MTFLSPTRDASYRWAMTAGNAPEQRGQGLQATHRQQIDAMARTIKELRESLPGKPSPATVAKRIGKSRVTWENYEKAERGAVLDLNVLTEVARALEITLPDLLLEYQRRLPPGTAVITPRSADGISDRVRAFEDAPSARRAVFPLEDGEAVLTLPKDLSAEGAQELIEYMEIFLRNLRRGKTN